MVYTLHLHLKVYLSLYVLTQVYQVDRCALRFVMIFPLCAL